MTSCACNILSFKKQKLAIFIATCEQIRLTYYTTYQTVNTPSIETHLAVVRGLPTKKFFPSASMRRAQRSVTVKVVRPTDLLNNVKYGLITDQTRLERPSLVKTPLSVQRPSVYMLAVDLVTFRLLAAAGRLLNFVMRKVAMLPAFTVGFQKVLKVVFYFSWLRPFKLILLHSC